MTRKKTIPPILPEMFEAMVAPWLRGIAHKDIVAVVSYPSSDRQRRLMNLLDDVGLQRVYLGDPTRYVWVTVDMRVDPIDDVDDLEALILERVTAQTTRRSSGQKTLRQLIHQLRHHNRSLVLTALGCERLIEKNMTSVLAWFTVMCRTETLRLLLFFETNLFNPESIAILKEAPTFQPHMHTLKLYDRRNAEQFILYLEQKWNIALRNETKQAILAQCGGCFLLIKAAVRCVREQPQVSLSDLWNHAEMRLNIRLLWEGFSATEQDVLRMAALRTPIDKRGYDVTTNYLRSTGFIIETSSGFQLTVPLLTLYVKHQTSQGRRIQVGQKRDILLNGVDVGRHFSVRQRRVLTYLLSHPNTLVSRDTVGERLWGENVSEKYSDWAVDSTISRLRVILHRLGIYGQLVTKKRHGFVWQEDKFYA